MRYRHGQDRGHGKEAEIGLFHSLTDFFHLLLADKAKQSALIASLLLILILPLPLGKKAAFL